MTELVALDQGFDRMAGVGGVGGSVGGINECLMLPWPGCDRVNHWCSLVRLHLAQHHLQKT